VRLEEIENSSLLLCAREGRSGGAGGEREGGVCAKERSERRSIPSKVKQRNGVGRRGLTELLDSTEKETASAEGYEEGEGPDELFDFSSVLPASISSEPERHTSSTSTPPPLRQASGIERCVQSCFAAFSRLHCRSPFSTASGKE
jgi:hypothetical protein